jgi:hypothetical protein
MSFHGRFLWENIDCREELQETPTQIGLMTDAESEKKTHKLMSLGEDFWGSCAEGKSNEVFKVDVLRLLGVWS